MAGIQAAAPSGKKPVVIVVIIVIAAALIAGGVIFFLNMNKSNDTKKEPVQTTASATEVQTTENVKTTDAQPTTKADQSSSQEETKQSSDSDEQTTTANADIVIPTEEGAEVTYFKATYIPNGQAEDAQTGEAVSLREALGSGYTDGALTFNDDGTFTDTITASGSSGKYLVQNNKITATYADDKNMEINVSSWKDGAPESFTVNYGGCIVHFG